LPSGSAGETGFNGSNRAVVLLSGVAGSSVVPDRNGIHNRSQLMSHDLVAGFARILTLKSGDIGDGMDGNALSALFEQQSVGRATGNFGSRVDVRK
jgi:hypothetical protein